MTDPNTRPPLPPFSYEEAVVKTRKAEDAWNSRNPEAIAQAYTEDSQWRNRADFPVGRAEIIAFLANKWQREQEYRLIKEVWAHSGNRIAVRFARSTRSLPASRTVPSNGAGVASKHWSLAARTRLHPGLMQRKATNGWARAKTRPMSGPHL